MSKAMYMDQPTSLVISGCLCVVAASLVVLVILHMYQTFCARRTYVRVPAVLAASERSSDVSDRSADNCCSSSTTQVSGTERRLDGDDIADQKTAMLPL